MSHLTQLIGDLDALTSQEKGDLVSMLEKEWGVKSSYTTQQEVVNTAPLELAVQTEFSVILTGFTSKIEAIKEVRQVTGLDLKSAKDFVEAAAVTPRAIREDVSREEADELARKLRASGALVEVK